MSIVISKKKKYIIILLCTLVLAGITAGIYLLINPKVNGSTSYTVDKYSDVVNWCNTSVKDSKLNIGCKALLLDIHNTEDGSSCFDLQVITKDKELKDLTVCEKGDTLSYTNEVLEYKKLMPLDISFSYSKEGILNSYVFFNVSLEPMGEEYIHSIVNEDIADLSATTLTKSVIPVEIEGGPSTSMVNFEETSIENSVDFCPLVEEFPDYITTENINSYTNFVEMYSLTNEQYDYTYLYNWNDNVIRILFACDSNPFLCDKTIPQRLALLSADTTSLSTQILYSQTFDDNDKSLLKEISLIYDSMFFAKQRNSYVNLALLNDLVVNINSQSETTEEMACGLYKIFSILDQEDSSFDNEIGLLSGIDVSQVTSSVCIDLLSDLDVDNTGLYLKLYFANQDINDFMIYNRCNNLRNYFK